jgi:hypothetical protein
MGFVGKIIQFIKRLLGIGTPEQAALGAGMPDAGLAGQAPGAPAMDDSLGTDDDEDDPAKNAQERWNELQQLIARFEQQGIDLVGVDPNDPVTFFHKQFAIEQETQDGGDYNAACQRQGFRDRFHLQEVADYVQAKWSVLGTDDDGVPDVVIRDEYNNAAIQARMGQVQQMQQAQLSADPSQLEPINGVSLEQWAQASAAMGKLAPTAGDAEVAQLLAQFGLDRATYDMASAGWQQRMQNDPTAAIATKYAEAFAGGGAAGAGGGGEPCSFEQYCEIMAAQAAWSEQGRDINAELQSTFGISAADFGQYSQYWAPKIGTDMALMRKQQELDQKYKQKYAGAAMDDDLAF